MGYFVCLFRSVLTQIMLCASHYHCINRFDSCRRYLFTLSPGCLDSYNGQCRLEAFAVPMFCFLLQNTTEAKSYWTTNHSNIQCETVSDAFTFAILFIFMVVPSNAYIGYPSFSCYGCCIGAEIVYIHIPWVLCGMYSIFLCILFDDGQENILFISTHLVSLLISFC